MLVASVRKIVKDSLYFLKLNMGRTFLHFNLFPHKFLLKYISNFFPHSIVTNKELFGIIYSINSFFKSRFFLEFLFVSIGSVVQFFCEIIHVHTLSLPLALGICAYCASCLSALFPG